MDPLSMLIATVVLLPAVGLVIWAQFTLGQINEDPQQLGGDDTVHRAFAPPSATVATVAYGAHVAKGAIWQIAA